MNPSIPGDSAIGWLRWAAIAAGVATLGLMLPLVWTAVLAGAGLLVLVLLLGLAAAVVQALPWLGQRLENALLSRRKAEARRNPIEQLQNELLRRAERLVAFREALVTVGGQVESIAQMLSERRERDPAHVMERHQRALDRLQQFHRLNIARLQQAQAALDDFRMLIERKESEWRIALAIDDASSLLDPRSADALLQDLLTDTALRTVQERFNSVFAELDVQMSSLDAPTRQLLEPTGRTPFAPLELHADAGAGSVR
ncbi:hypothetical protein [Ramlibacter rhizophilus]|uniref:Uncharacterized protein n=1 Tax=Ramlibacter rhizophilus TaxID=1781167 RepID=A0A4Z0BY77_9BURK|nr:hypothetical protein [Ramlibacter rhizophilus]TFZ03474.1 hypothetical protein EZ242_06265 [Ramlibacter rhizophilus]